MPTRRSFLQATAALATSTLLSGCRTADPPLEDAGFTEDQYRQFPLLGLATSLYEEFDYAPQVEGRLPAELQGTLYRNGPGLFQRQNYRKRCLLDGDGMVQAFRFRAGEVRYRNRFVRTPKYVAEEAAGRFLYPTWTTQAPGGLLNNLFHTGMVNQAGVTVVVRDGRLYAFDEFQPPFRLDPETLATLGEDWLGLTPHSTVLSAHSKIDPVTGHWVFFGLFFDQHAILHLTTLDRQGQLLHHRTYPLPRYTYFHDVFLTQNHVVLLLPPLTFSPFRILLGRSAFTGALHWHSDMSSQVLVFARESDAPPRLFEGPPCWMWHSINARETDGEIQLDFVGFDQPDHFLGPDPALFAIMQGRRGDRRFPGTMRRFRLDLGRGRLQAETLSTESHEFPTIDPARLGRASHFAYAARMRSDPSFFTAICRVDTDSGQEEEYDYGPGVYCSEPVFVPTVRRDTDHGEGWLMTEVYDSHKRRSFLSVLRADALGDGPVANLWLRHHVPLGFHGWWAPAE